ncbi:MAG: urease accessory protein UreF [Methyloligellaceae bacterium]
METPNTTDKQAVGPAVSDQHRTSLLRLMTWLSPSYPVGAYTYSHGLENAVETGVLKTVEDAFAWLQGVIRFGAGQSDVVLLRHAYKAIKDNDDQALFKCAEMAEAFCGTEELALETMAQGRAFLDITSKSWPCEAVERLIKIWPEQPAYPVVVGVAAAGHGVALEDTAVAYLHAMVANLVSALVRLVPFGQTDGQILTARLEAVVIETAGKALKIPLEEISNSCMMIDISSMQHETQHTRLFRS